MAEPEEKSSRKRQIFTLIKWTLCLIVLIFVGQQGYRLWNQDELHEVSINWVMLIPAGIAYLLGWIPSVWFWRKLMLACGCPVDWKNSTRAYYCGHLGKYIPGKAMVLVIRSAMVKDHGCRPTIAALTATCETLLMMGTGLVVTFCLLPFVFSKEHLAKLPGWLTPLLEWQGLLPVVGLTATFLLVPVIAYLVSFVGRKMTPREFLEEKPIQIKSKLIFQGLLGFGFCWIGLGLSLGFVLKSLQPEFVLTENLWSMVAASALATSVGFLAIFAPGGVGVREGLLMWALQAHPEIGPAQAVASAVLLRLLWLFCEIGVAAALYYGIKPTPPATSPTHPATGDTA